MAIRRNKLRTLLFAAIAIVAMIALSAGLNELEFSPGRPLSVGESSEIALAGKSPSENSFTGIVLMLFNLIRLLLPLSIIYFIVSPRARKEVLRGLIVFLPLLMFLLLLSARPDLFEGLRTEQVQPPDRPSPSDTLAPDAEFPADSPQWLVFVATLGLAVLIAAGLVWIGWLIWRRFRRPVRPLERLAREAQDALEALQKGADFRDTIMRCYYEMSQVLSQQRGLKRERTMTAREFEAYLEEAGLPGEYIQQLTRLFEGVRYGAKVADEGQERLAKVCLAAIVGFCESSS